MIIYDLIILLLYIPLNSLYRNKSFIGMTAEEHSVYLATLPFGIYVFSILDYVLKLIAKEQYLMILFGTFFFAALGLTMWIYLFRNRIKNVVRIKVSSTKWYFTMIAIFYFLGSIILAFRGVNILLNK